MKSIKKYSNLIFYYKFFLGKFTFQIEQKTSSLNNLKVAIGSGDTQNGCGDSILLMKQQQIYFNRY